MFGQTYLDIYIDLHSNFLLKHTKIEKSSYDIHGKTLFYQI
jgi:hypothetical protein